MKIEVQNNLKIYGECLSLKIDSNFRNIYIASTDKTYTQISLKSPGDTIDHKMKILKDFNKSAKSVIYYLKQGREIHGCVSYDGTGILFQNSQEFDMIEGPDTEIKHISINEDASLVSLATRGKTVWVLSVQEACLEIEKILDDHSMDVKGAKFHGNLLYTYGYDETIKVYGFLEAYNNDLTLIDNISLKSLEISEAPNSTEKNLLFDNYTVWDILFTNNAVIAAANTEIFIFDSEMTLKSKKRVSEYPIYCLQKISENIFALIFNEDSIKLFKLENYHIIEVGFSQNVCLRINCMDYHAESGTLIVGGEEKSLKILKISGLDTTDSI